MAVVYQTTCFPVFTTGFIQDQTHRLTQYAESEGSHEDHCI